MGKLPWDSIKTSHDYKRITTTGEKFITPVFISFSLKEEIEKTRLGIIASKKVGNAVKRNRVKRVIKAAFSGVANNLKNVSVVLIARNRILATDYADIVSWVNKIA